MKKKAFHQDGDEMSANAPDYHKTSGKLNNSLPLIAHVVIILRDVTNYHCHISPHKKAQYCSCTTESPTLTVIRCIFFIQASGFSRARCCLNYWSLHSLSIKSSVIHREGGGGASTLKISNSYKTRPRQRSVRSCFRGGSRQRLLHTVTGVKARIKPSRKLHLN